MFYTETYAINVDSERAVGGSVAATIVKAGSARMLKNAARIARAMLGFTDSSVVYLACRLTRC